MTVATLPISPSVSGMSCTSTVASSPGLIVPSAKTNSPCTPRDDLGLVSTTRVPLGIWSWISTPLAATVPVLRTTTRNAAGLPTWISGGAIFWMVSCGACGPSSRLSPGRPTPSAAAGASSPAAAGGASRRGGAASPDGASAGSSPDESLGDLLAGSVERAGVANGSARNGAGSAASTVTLGGLMDRSPADAVGRDGVTFE